MQITLCRSFLAEPKPVAVVPVSKVRNAEPSFTTQPLSGKNWIRVFPHNAADVFLLQSLEQHVDKFAPATGHGVLVKRSSLGMD